MSAGKGEAGKEKRSRKLSEELRQIRGRVGKEGSMSQKTRYTSCYVKKRSNRKKHPYVVILAGHVEEGGVIKRTEKQVGSYGTRRAAERKKAGYDYGFSTSTFVEPALIDLGTYLEGWLKEYVETGDYKIRSKETYVNVVRRYITPSLGHIRIQDLSVNDIEKYYNDCRRPDRRLSEGTIRQHHAILHKALETAMVSKKLIPSNPADSVMNKPKRKRNDKVLRTWTREEAGAFLRAAREMGERQAAFYGMALETGMRKGELCGLSWSDVRLARGAAEIVVRHQLVRAGRNWQVCSPKNGKERMIAISDSLAEDLLRWKEVQRILKESNKQYVDSGLVFTSPNGGPLTMNNIGEREFAKLMKRAKVSKLRFHDMRHTNASLLLADGVNVKLVSERLGHSSVTITMEIYCHIDRDAHRRVARSFDERGSNCEKLAPSGGRGEGSGASVDFIESKEASNRMEYRH